jgi:predicted transcriptional regulator
MPKLFHPQEMEVAYVLPAMRREIAKAMKKKGVSQKEIAERLHVTGAAVSQYLSSKRASQVQFGSKLKKAISAAAVRITDIASLRSEVQKLLKLARSEKITCGICKKISGAKCSCGACFG